ILRKFGVNENQMFNHPRRITEKADVWRIVSFLKQWLSKGYRGSIRKHTELSHLSSAERIGYKVLST
ncbi:MAG: hypothetical protein CXX80_08935, partial [Methanobacteriota archaeon]